MRQVVELPDFRPGVTTTHYTSHMHGERTQVDVFTRIPDFLFRRLRMGRTELIAMRCGTTSIRREPADVRARPNRILTFVHQVHGRSTFRHYGNEVTLEEGDFTLCNNSRPYDLRLQGISELIMFRVPTDMVCEHIPSPDIICGRRLARQEGLASMAGAMAQDLATKDPTQLQPEAGERGGRHLLDVIASSYMSLLDEGDSCSAVMQARFWKVKLFIDEHLRDPDLSPSFIASSLRLSDRYLRMIFAVSGESPSAYILRRRLEECAAQLGDPHWRNHSISNIAFSWGFNSAPHFTRKFRAQYLCSPSDFREQKLSESSGLH